MGEFKKKFEKIWRVLAANGYTAKVERSRFAGGALCISADKNNGEKSFCIYMDNGSAVYYEYTWESEFANGFPFWYKGEGRQVWYNPDDETLLQFVERMINL